MKVSLKKFLFLVLFGGAVVHCPLIIKGGEPEGDVYDSKDDPTSGAVDRHQDTMTEQQREDLLRQEQDHSGNVNPTTVRDRTPSSGLADQGGVQQHRGADGSSGNGGGTSISDIEVQSAQEAGQAQGELEIGKKAAEQTLGDLDEPSGTVINLPPGSQALEITPENLIQNVARLKLRVFPQDPTDFDAEASTMVKLQKMIDEELSLKGLDQERKKHLRILKTMLKKAASQMFKSMMDKGFKKYGTFKAIKPGQNASVQKRIQYKINLHKEVTEQLKDLKNELQTLKDIQSNMDSKKDIQSNMDSKDENAQALQQRITDLEVQQKVLMVQKISTQSTQISQSLDNGLRQGLATESDIEQALQDPQLDADNKQTLSQSLLLIKETNAMLKLKVLESLYKTLSGDGVSGKNNVTNNQKLFNQKENGKVTIKTTTQKIIDGVTTVLRSKGIIGPDEKEVGFESFLRNTTNRALERLRGLRFPDNDPIMQDLKAVANGQKSITSVITLASHDLQEANEAISNAQPPFEGGDSQIADILKSKAVFGASGMVRKSIIAKNYKKNIADGDALNSQLNKTLTAIDTAFGRGNTDDIKTQIEQAQKEADAMIIQLQETRKALILDKLKGSKASEVKAVEKLLVKLQTRKEQLNDRLATLKTPEIADALVTKSPRLRSWYNRATRFFKDLAISVKWNKSQFERAVETVISKSNDVTTTEEVDGETRSSEAVTFEKSIAIGKTTLLPGELGDFDTESELLKDKTPQEKADAFMKLEQIKQVELADVETKLDDLQQQIDNIELLSGDIQKSMRMQKTVFDQIKNETTKALSDLDFTKNQLQEVYSTKLQEFDTLSDRVERLQNTFSAQVTTAKELSDLGGLIEGGASENLTKITEAVGKMAQNVEYNGEQIPQFVADQAAQVDALTGSVSNDIQTLQSAYAGRTTATADDISAAQVKLKVLEDKMNQLQTGVDQMSSQVEQVGDLIDKMDDGDNKDKLGQVKESLSTVSGDKATKLEAIEKEYEALTKLMQKFAKLPAPKSIVGRIKDSPITKGVIAVGKLAGKIVVNEATKEIGKQIGKAKDTVVEKVGQVKDAVQKGIDNLPAMGRKLGEETGRAAAQGAARALVGP